MRQRLMGLIKKSDGARREEGPLGKLVSGWHDALSCAVWFPTWFRRSLLIENLDRKDRNVSL
jgi:hypothetical protein